MHQHIQREIPSAPWGESLRAQRLGREDIPASVLPTKTQGPCPAVTSKAPSLAYPVGGGDHAFAATDDWDEECLASW